MAVSMQEEVSSALLQQLTYRNNVPIIAVMSLVLTAPFLV